MQNAKKYFLNSVRPSTRATYGTGERRWFVVADSIGTDPLMRMIPRDWVHRKDGFRMSTLTWRESCMLAFLASCRDSKKAVSPKTAFGYLSAVRKFLEENGIDIKFLDNSQYIRNTKAGMVNAYRAEVNIDERDSERLAVSVDMIVGNDKYLQHKSNYGIAQRAVYVAQILGYTTLSRVSEYLLVPGEAEHLLVSECVAFETHGGQLVTSCDLEGITFSDVKGCVIDILSAKNDKLHKGNRMYFGLADLNDPAQVYCLTTTLWEYAKASRPVRGRSFFFLPGINWTLKPRYFNQCLREMAVLYHLDPDRVSSHSLRIGGASALAAAGVPDYIIMDMGRWRSLTFLAYVRRSAQMFETARSALARNNLLTVDNIRLMSPGCSTIAGKL